MTSPIDPKTESAIDKANRLNKAAQMRQVALSMAVGPTGTKEQPDAVVKRAATYFAWLSEPTTEGAK